MAETSLWEQSQYAAEQHGSLQCKTLLAMLTDHGSRSQRSPRSRDGSQSHRHVGCLPCGVSLPDGHMGGDDCTRPVLVLALSIDVWPEGGVVDHRQSLLGGELLISGSLKSASDCLFEVPVRRGKVARYAVEAAQWARDCKGLRVSGCVCARYSMIEGCDEWRGDTFPVF